AAQARDELSVVVYPGGVPQPLLARYGLDDDRPRSREIGVRSDGEGDRLAGEVLKSLIEVCAVIERRAIDREQVVPGCDLEARLRQRRVELRAPAAAIVDAGDPVVAVLEAVVRTEETDADLIHLRLVAAADEHVPHGLVTHHLAE